MPRNKKANETKLTLAAPGSQSLRTTVPAFIVCQLSLRCGDILTWKVEEKNVRIEFNKNRKMRCADTKDG